MGNNFRYLATGYGLAIKYGVMMVFPIFFALIIGIAVDKHFGTTPIAIFVFTILGMVFSLYSVYRVVTRSEAFNRRKEEQ